MHIKDIETSKLTQGKGKNNGSYTLKNPLRHSLAAG